MKVCSGKYGGRKLADNKYEHIRPTADIVKQAIFNRLTDEIVGAQVLDLFCGTGALGIEALSRGAKEVVFADKDKRSLMLTTANLKSLNIHAKTINADFEIATKYLKGQKFDIILLDPPYKSGLYEKALAKIIEYDLLNNDGVVVCEQDKNTEIDFSPFYVEAEKRYGIKIVSYLRLKR